MAANSKKEVKKEVAKETTNASNKTKKPQNKKVKVEMVVEAPQEENIHRSNLRGPNELSKSAKSSMVTRMISAVVGLAIVVPAVLLGDWIYFAFMAVMLGIACWEILGCANRRTLFIFIAYFIFVALIAYWPLFKALVTNGTALGKIDEYYGTIYLSVIVVTIGVFLLFGLTVIYKDFSVQDACFLMTMGILIGFGFQCLYYLRYYPHRLFNIEPTTFQFNWENTFKASQLIIFVIFSTFMTDTGAYFVGVFFGKNKMNERISPKKTWEGFVGGIVISSLLTFSAGMICAACGYPIIPHFTIRRWYLILIISLIIPLFATLGDFVFSSIKRYWGIKDYGKLIPGHGGVLDRLDSIFFACIVAAIFVFMLSALREGKFNWEAFLV